MSSPITQWREKVREALAAQFEIEDDPSCAKDHFVHDVDVATSNITSATIELIQNAQHDDAKTCSCSLASYLLFDLRQSLKEMKGE